MNNNYKGKGIKAQEDQMIEDMRNFRGSLSDIKETASSTRYDAYNDLCIIECKARKTHYEDQLIERGKYDALRDFSSGRVALYAVYDPSGYIYVYNLNKLHKEEYDYNWGQMGGLPTTSHFSNTKRITKHVGTLNIKDAYWTIQVH